MHGRIDIFAKSVDEIPKDRERNNALTLLPMTDTILVL
jgi:hypothetical protein